MHWKHISNCEAANPRTVFMFNSDMYIYYRSQPYDDHTHTHRITGAEPEAVYLYNHVTFVLGILCRTMNLAKVILSCYPP